MFNDILTGKASIEPPPVQPDPYRQESVPDETRSCTSCRQAFTVKATSTANQCAACHLIDVQRNQAMSNAALAQAAESIRRSDNSHRILSGLLIVAVGIGLAVFRYGMRKQYRDDMAKANGYSSYSDYQSQSSYGSVDYTLSSYEGDMCRCQDLACSREVLRKFHAWSRSTDGMQALDGSTEANTDAAAHLFACAARHEQ